jgi:hypothetical protein
MKSIERLRGYLNKAIETGCSKEDILSISRELDVLIVKQMIIQNEQHMKRRVS